MQVQTLVVGIMLDQNHLPVTSLSNSPWTDSVEQSTKSGWSNRHVLMNSAVDRCRRKKKYKKKKNGSRLEMAMPDGLVPSDEYVSFRSWPRRLVGRARAGWPPRTGAPTAGRCSRHSSTQQTSVCWLRTNSGWRISLIQGRFHTRLRDERVVVGAAKTQCPFIIGQLTYTHRHTKAHVTVLELNAKITNFL